MTSLNRVTILGNVGRDPEVRQLQDGTKVCNLSVTTSDRWKDKATGEQREKTEWHKGGDPVKAEPQSADPARSRRLPATAPGGEPVLPDQRLHTDRLTQVQDHAQLRRLRQPRLHPREPPTLSVDPRIRARIQGCGADRARIRSSSDPGPAPPQRGTLPWRALAPLREHPAAAPGARSG